MLPFSKRGSGALALAVLGLVAAGTARAVDVSLGLDGCPATIYGRPGEPQTFQVYATLTTSGNELGAGAQGWSLGVTADGGTIQEIALDGIVVPTLLDSDANPATPPVDFPLTLTAASFADAQSASKDTRSGAISEVILSSSKKKVTLRPAGTVRVARITVQASIPDGSLSSPVTVRFEDGFRGVGLAIENLVNFDGINHHPVLGSCTATLVALPDIQLGFAGCPGPMTGAPGEVKTFQVDSTLTTSSNGLGEGAQGWSTSLTADGGTITAISLDGIVVPTLYDSDGNPATSPVAFPLALSGASFADAQLASLSGKPGAVSAIILSSSKKKMTLPATGTVTIAHLTVDAPVPPGTAPGAVTLSYVDGFQGDGLPIDNLVNVEGLNLVPTPGTCTVPLSSHAAVGLSFEGYPAEVHGRVGDLKTFDVVVDLASGSNPMGVGAQGWSLSLTAGGGTIKSIALDGIVVPTLFDSDGNPATPPVDFPLDLTKASFADAQTAAKDSRPGAVAEVILSSSKKKITLQPGGTVRVARFTVEALIPDGTGAVTLRFEDGFQGSGLPVSNLVNFDGVNVTPALGTGTVVLTSLPAVDYAFEGCPAKVAGKAGETTTFDVFTTLATSENSGDVGPQGWSTSLTADGGTIAAISLDGVVADALIDDDSDPSTPPTATTIDLGLASFAEAQIAAKSGKPGAVTAVILSSSKKKLTLPASGTSRTAKVSVTAVLPAAGESSPLTLRYEDGFQGEGLPVTNVANFDGTNVSPGLASCSVTLEAGASAANQLPGDITQDARLDISDGIRLLGFLFVGTVKALPCGDGTAADAGNKALADFNGDARLDLSDAVGIFAWLFTGGNAHVLGTGCQLISGCPQVCK